jgi:hypothetical protein
MNKTFDQGKDEITKLCRYFETNRQAFLAPGVKEAHVRQSLIDPLFEALGWDVRNTARIAPQYREVVPEDSLEVEGRLKAPDYSFRVGATEKFYAEAKKCGVSIGTDPAPAHQLRCYGWSAKAALSILTTFEELSVYDCTLRPRPTDKASRARILYLRFDEYPVRWREIWDIFSREAVWGGSFDQFAESKRGKRGSSEVDVEFLKEIEGWRDELARNMAARNPGLSREDLNRAVQLTIDRIVFLRMAEDRRIEIYESLLRLTDRPDIYRRFVSDLCKRADAKYNSGLFDLRADKRFNDLDVDDKVLKPILQSLYFEHGSPYAFRAMPVEILGTVYERFLGRTITLTEGHRARIEEKPEVRKAGGVYYTPSYIVDYIVQNTVGWQIEGKSPKELRGEGRGGGCGERRDERRDARPFRVLDMACGSGSFLLGAYQCLLDYYLKWYTDNDPSKHKGAVWEVGGAVPSARGRALRHTSRREKVESARREDTSATQDLFPLVAAQPPVAAQAPVAANPPSALVAQPPSALVAQPASALVAQPASGGMTVRESAAKWQTRSSRARDAAPPDTRPEWRLTIPEKKRILTTHIFGVDIDPQAVEVAKLSLLLKVLEGEDEQSLGPQLDLFPGSTDRALPNLDQNIKCGNSLIGPDYFSGRIVHDPEEMKRVNAFDWNAEFPEAMRAGGFDCVIGNPPYVQISKEMHPPEEIGYYRRFRCFQYKSDLFHLFIERAIQLLTLRGHFGYIVPNPWLTLQFATNIRALILQECRITEIVLFDHLVFEQADVHTALLFFQKGKAEKGSRVRVRNVRSAKTDEDIVSSKPHSVRQADWQKDPLLRFETRLVGKAGNLVKRVQSAFPPLENVARVSLGCQAYNSSKHTPEQIKKRVFHADKKVSSNYLPELAGRDVSRYFIKREKGKWIRYGEWLHDYRSMDWLQGPRILIREIPGNPPYRIHACYVEETYCNYKTILNVNPSPDTNISMKYLQGILASRLISFLYPLMSNKMVAQSFPRLSVRDVRRIPICAVDLQKPSERKKHDRMVALVESMLDLHKHLAAARSEAHKTVLQRQIAATDTEIDRLVYDLYDLSAEEIAIVEGTAC